jgi:hypothetical protein
MMGTTRGKTTWTFGLWVRKLVVTGTVVALMALGGLGCVGGAHDALVPVRPYILLMCDPEFPVNGCVD